MAGSEVGREIELPDADADEAEGWEADGCGHFADLAIAAFVEGEFDPARGDILAEADGRIAWGKVGVDVICFGGESFASFDDHAFLQRPQCGIGHLAFDLRPISACVGVFWVEEFGIETGFVGEKKKSFAVAVEATERIHVFREREFGQRALSGMIRRELGEDAEGFV